MPQLIVISLLGLFVFIYFIPQIFITIHSGEGGVHFRRFFQGTVTDVVYGEGLQIIFPWDEMVVYNGRIQESKMTLDLLTSEGLSARVKVSVRYYPEYELLGMLHKRVGRNYAEVLVLPEVESVLRMEVSRLTAESLYTTSDLAVTQVVVKAIDELVSNYVVINDVIIVLVAQLIGVAPGQFVALVAFTQLSESFQHANLRLSFGRVGEYLWVSPRFHRVHHSIGIGHESLKNEQTVLGGHNFGVLLPWWDVLFGTANFQERYDPTGIRDQVEANRDYGRGFWSQQWVGLKRLFGRA